MASKAPALLLLALAACAGAQLLQAAAPAAELQSSVQQLQPFTNITSCVPFNVLIQPNASDSNTYTLTAAAEPAVLSSLNATVSNGTLFLQTSGNFSTQRPIQVALTLPAGQLQALEHYGTGGGALACLVGGGCAQRLALRLPCQLLPAPRWCLLPPPAPAPSPAACRRQAPALRGLARILCSSARPQTCLRGVLACALSSKPHAGCHPARTSLLHAASLPSSAGSEIYVAPGFNVSNLTALTGFGAGRLYVSGLIAQNVSLAVAG